MSTHTPDRRFAYARGLREAGTITTLWRCLRHGTTQPGAEPEYTWAESPARVRAARDGSFDGCVVLAARRDEQGGAIDVIYSELSHAVTSRLPLEEEVELVTTTGERRWFRHQIIPLGDGVAVTSRDVTDRKQAEAELPAFTLVEDLTGRYHRRGFRMLAEQHPRLLSKRGGRRRSCSCPTSASSSK